MNLRFNNLSGRIPSDLGNLILLEYLLLNKNHFSGEIPSTFGNLSSLLGCDFSNNNLSGPLPSVLLFQSMDVISFVGNKGLCGGLLGDCNGKPSIDSVPPSQKAGVRERKIVFGSAVVGGVSLVLIVLIICIMRRQPVEKISAIQDKDIPTPVSDIYFPQKEGFTFEDLVEATNNFDVVMLLERELLGQFIR